MLFGAAPSGPFAPSTTPKQLPSVDGLVAHQAAPAAAAPVAVRPNVTSAGLGLGSSSSPFGTIGSSQQQQQLGGDGANNISSYDALFGVGNSASSLDVTSFWTGGGGFAAAGHSLDELHSPTTTAAAAAAVGTGATPTQHNSNHRGASAEPPVQYATMDDALMALGRRVKSFRVVAGADLDRYATAFHAGAATRQFPPDTELRQVFVGQLPALLTADRLAAALGAMTDCPDMPTLVHIRSGQTQASHALVTVEAKRAKALLGLNRRAYLTDKALYFAHAFRDIPDFQRVVSKAINATTKEGMQRLALACVVLEKTRRPVTCGTPTSNGSAAAAPSSPEKQQQQQPSSSSPTAVQQQQQQQQHAPVLRVQQPSFPATTGGAAASFTPPPPTLPPYMATPPPMYATASHHLQHHVHHHHHQHQHPHAFYAAHHHHAAAAAMMLHQSAAGGGFNPQSHRAAAATATATTTMLDANGRPQQGMFVWVPMPETGTA